MDRDERQTRTVESCIRTRADTGEELVIEGYFAVFNQETELFPGAYERIAPEAFEKTLDRDVRALWNHDTSMVLGRNKAGTLKLRTDSHGLYGEIRINPKDTEAMNLYERVKRGDVDQCSFGFCINQEETEYREDGSVMWTIRGVDLYEVSVCTFPAYEDTGVSARCAEYADIRKRKLEARKKKLKERLKHGVKTTDAE